jgi:hypothetical protein
MLYRDSAHYDLTDVYAISDQIAELIALRNDKKLI